MNLIFVLMLSFCSIFQSDQMPCVRSWQYFEGSSTGKTIEKQNDNSNEIIIPFLWTNINSQLLDSIIQEGASRDSIMNFQSQNSPEFVPEPVYRKTKDIFILYGEKNILADSDCTYTVFTFYLNKGAEFFEHNCYEVFYVKEIGVIGVVHKMNNELSFEWEKYLLVNMKDKQGKSVIDKTKLGRLVSKSINYYLK